MGFLSNLFKKTDYKSLVENGAIILDVRSKSEFASGHIEGSLNIPLDQIDGQISSLKKSGKPVITCCASGIRSGVAKGNLKSKGIEAYNGGGWQSLKSKIS